MRYAGHTQFSQKMRFQGFISEILRMVSLLGQKFIFFKNSLGKTKILTIFKPSVYIHGVLPINFLEQFELCSYLIIREVIKFYNLGHKKFETDFSTLYKYTLHLNDLLIYFEHVSFV